MSEMLTRPARPVVGRRDHRRRGGDPRRHPAAGDGDARDDLTRLQAVDDDDWSWGRLHRLDLENQTLGTSGDRRRSRRWLNRGPWRTAGGGTAVDATSWDAAEDFGVTSAPSMRMVVSIADFDESRWVNLTGVSGHPFSDHYTDQTDLWAEGETLPWPFSQRGGRGRRRGHAHPAARPRAVIPAGLAAASTVRSCGSTGTVHAHLVVVEQHARERADRHPRQGPVVAAAAASEPDAGGRDGEARDEHDVGGRDRVDAEPGPDRLEQSHPAPAPASPARRTPPSPGRGRGARRGAAPACPRRPARRAAVRYRARSRSRRTPRRSPRGVRVARPAGAGRSRPRRRRPRPAAGGCARSAAGRAAPAWRPRNRVVRGSWPPGQLRVASPGQPTIEVWVVQP